MQQKNFSSITLIVVVIIIATIAGYLILSQHTIRSIPTETNTDNSASKSLQSVTTKATSDWKTFKHTRFTLKYPPNMIVGSNNMRFEANEAPDVSVFINGEPPEFNIWQAHTPLSKDDSYFNPEHEDPELVEQWDIKTFSEKIWQLNKRKSESSAIKDYSVSNLEKITVGGRDAYMFSVTGAYADYNEAGLRENKTTYIFVADGDGNRYKIFYPSNEEQSMLILQSLQFAR